MTERSEGAEARLGPGAGPAGERDQQAVEGLRLGKAGHPAIGAAFASIIAAAVQDPAAREVLSSFLAGAAARAGALVAA